MCGFVSNFKDFRLQDFERRTGMLLVKCRRGVQLFSISETHWKKKSCLGPHIKYTNTNKH